MAILHADAEINVASSAMFRSARCWSIDAGHFYFHRLPPQTPGLFNTWRIRPDGGDLEELIAPRPAYVNEYPVNALN